MKSLIEQGIERSLIRFEDGDKYIVYVHQNKRRTYTNPEEQVQAETFLKLAKIVYLAFGNFIYSA